MAYRDDDEHQTRPVKSPGIEMLAQLLSAMAKTGKLRLTIELAAGDDD